jgi:hypothetical protein
MGGRGGEGICENMLIGSFDSYSALQHLATRLVNYHNMALRGHLVGNTSENLRRSLLLYLAVKATAP